MSDYFSTLEIIPIQLSLEPKEIEERYFKISKKLHPDINASSDSLEKTADLNEAYRLLKDPWRRAEYWISLQKERLDSSPPAHLTGLYFEAQETKSPGTLEDIRDRLCAEKLKYEDELWKLFRRHDRSELILFELKQVVSNYKYIQSMLRDLERK